MWSTCFRECIWPLTKKGFHCTANAPPRFCLFYRLLCLFLSFPMDFLLDVRVALRIDWRRGIVRYIEWTSIFSEPVVGHSIITPQLVMAAG